MRHSEPLKMRHTLVVIKLKLDEDLVRLKFCIVRQEIDQIRPFTGPNPDRAGLISHIKEKYMKNLDGALQKINMLPIEHKDLMMVIRKL